MKLQQLNFIQTISNKMQNGNNRSSYSVERTNYNDTNMRTFQRTNKSLSNVWIVDGDPLVDMCTALQAYREHMIHDYCYIALIILSSGIF